MTPAMRARRMLETLPQILQRGRGIDQLFRVVSAELSGADGIEDGVTRVLRSRWHTLAEGFGDDAPPVDKAVTELGRIGALYNLFPARSESADGFRRHLTTFIALHRAGITTIPAIFGLVALVYLAEAPPEITWEGRTVVARFEVLEPDGSRSPVRLELIENPTVPASAFFDGVAAGQQVVVVNNGLDDALPDIALTAPANKAVAVPVLTQKDTDLLLLFAGVVPAGATLLLRDQRAPLLNGAPVTDPVIRTRPSRFFDPTSAEPPARFGSLDHPRARFSIFDRSLALPALAPGENRWSYDTVDRARLLSYLTGSPDAAQLAQQALLVKDSPDVRLQLRWTEVAGASFVLRIPADYVPPHFRAEDPTKRLAVLVRELGRALDYGRAAGVRAHVELSFVMPSESLAISESAVAIATTQTFTDAETASDAMYNFGQLIDFDEQVPPIDDDRITWTGLFDGTRFETSIFQ
jgi:hypothetical protein